MGWADNLRLQSILPVALSMMGGNNNDSLGVATQIAGALGRNRGKRMAEDLPESGGYGGNLGRHRVNWPDFGTPTADVNAGQGVPLGGNLPTDRYWYDQGDINDAIMNGPGMNQEFPGMRSNEQDNLPSRVSPQLEMQIPGGNPTQTNPRAIGGINPNDPTAFELFKRSILGMPERTRPNIWRALGTGALSTANMLEGKGGKPLGYDEASHILYDPYEQAVARWGKQTGALKDLSTIEGQMQRAEGLPEQRRASAEANIRRAGVAETAEQRKQREGEANIQLRQRKLDIDEWKAKNPTGKIVMPKGGNVILVNPQTGETTDTGIPTGSLSDTDKIEYEHRNTVADINLRHANELKQLEQRHQERLGEISATGDIQKEVAGVKGEESRKTKGTPSVSTVEYKSITPGTTTTVKGVPGGTVTAKTTGQSTTGTNTSGGRGGVPPNTNTAPKVGDIKTFPNGRKGRFDGTAWRPI